MTTLFISHGAPTLAIELGATGELLAELGRSLVKPDAILVVSAHWDISDDIAKDTGAQFKISTAAAPKTIHDFGGFPKAMYQIQYPANGALTLANETAELLNSAGFKIQTDKSRGLDHGAWVPLMLMYPNADIPVTQLSINSSLSIETHVALGKAISQLQDKNVLILCSGAITHNLNDFSTMQRDGKPLEYVGEFTDWVAENLSNNQIDTLMDYRKNSKSGARAHPSQDHILPFFVALGAGAKEGKIKAKRYQPETTYGFLAMDIYVW